MNYVMNSYNIYNGYNAFDGPLFIVVIAKSEKKAIELAREEYKEEAKQWKYTEDFYTNLTAELVEEDVLKHGGYVAGAFL
ncbi:hypothetical protein ACEPPU_24165 [Priestia aryabhattai]|uniref:hypothetical protein n=1 Tax=Priestia aryabhattai TaxID=412384 RepID=UPI0035ABA6F4